MSAAAKSTVGTIITLGIAGAADKLEPATSSPAQSRTIPILPGNDGNNPAVDSRLQRYLVDLEKRVHELSVQAGASILGGGNLVKNVSLTANTLVTVAHRLNRAATHFIAVATQPNGAWSSTNGPILGQPLPTGLTSDKYIAIEANWTGTADLYVF